MNRAPFVRDELEEKIREFKQNSGRGRSDAEKHAYLSAIYDFFSYEIYQIAELIMFPEIKEDDCNG